MSKKQTETRIKRAIAHLLIVAMLMLLLPVNAFIASAAESNVITNGDFEASEVTGTPVVVEAGSSASAVLGLPFNASGGTAGTDASIAFECVSVEGANGGTTKAMKVSRAENQTATARKNLLASVEVNDLNTSSAYTLSVRWKAVGVTESTKFEFKYKYLGVTGATFTYVQETVNANAYTDWTLASVVIPASELTQYAGKSIQLNMYIQGLTDGYVLIDDLVLAPCTLVESVTLSEESKELLVGQTLTLTATVSPDDAYDKTVAYTSNNEAVATVDATGKVTAVSAGTAVITATSVSNNTVSDTCTITVTSNNFITNGDFEASEVTGTPVVVEAGSSASAVLGLPFNASGGTAGTDASIAFECVSVEGANGGTTKAMKVSRAENQTATARKNLLASVEVNDLNTSSAYTLSVRWKAVGVTESTKFEFKYKYLGVTGATFTYVQETVNANAYTDWTLASVVIPASELTQYAGKSIQLNMYIQGLTDGYVLIDDLVLAPCTLVESVTLSAETAELQVGEVLTLTATVSPDDAYDKTVAYTSGNEAVAVVDETGKVIAVSEGTAVITATSVSNNTKSATCTVTVKRDNLIVNGDFENTLAEDAKSVTVIDKNSQSELLGTNLSVNSGDTGDSLIFEQATVTGVDGANTQALKISTTDGASARKTIQARIPVDSLNLETAYKFSFWAKAVDMPADSAFKIESVKYRNGGGTFTVTANRDVVFAANVEDTSLGEWTQFSTVILASSMAEVGNWLDLMISINSLTTGYFLVDNMELVPWIAVESVTLPYESKRLEIGDELSLAATISPEYAPENTVIYTSSDETVATVDATGKVTAIAKGETTIIATATNGGAKATCVITVVDEDVPLTAISMASTLALFKDEQQQLTITYTPENATDKTITWSSSDDTVATVTQDGVVTALKAGTATITAAGADGTSATCAVTVTESTTLSTAEANLTADFGTLLEGNLASFVTNNTGAALSFQLQQGTTAGTIKVNTNGTFTYMPKVYDAANVGTYLLNAQANTDGDTFQVLVIAGDQRAVLTGKITVATTVEEKVQNLTPGMTLLVSEAKIEEIKALLAANDPTTVKLWKNLKEEADRIMLMSIPVYADHSADTNSEGNWIRGVSDRIPNLLFAALISPDVTEAAQYKAKCIDYLEAVIVDYAYWGERGGDGTTEVYGEGHLAAGHAAFATAVAASWLYDDLTDELKTSVHQRMYKVCNVMDYIWRNHANIIGNHMWNAFGGMTAASMLMYTHPGDAFAAISALDFDEVASTIGLTIDPEDTVDELKASCVEWLGLVCDQMGVAFDLMPADGANHESPMYHTYGLEDMLKVTLLMDGNLEVDMFTANTWMEKSIDYMLNIILPVNSLGGTQVMTRYGNTHKYLEYGASPLMRVLASYYQNGTAQWIAQTLEDTGADPVSESLAGTAFWMSLLYADGDLAIDDPADEPTLYFADDLGIVVSRTDWSGDESVVFMRSGAPLGKRNMANLIAEKVEIGHSCGDHQDIDCNAIRLFYNGEELLRENGYKDSKSTASQSTLLVNGNGQLKDGWGAQSSKRYEELQASPEITKTVSTDIFDYFVGDATESYEPELGLTKFARHVVLIKDANVLLVVDDIKTQEATPLELRWFPENKTVVDLNQYGYYSVLNKNSEMRFYPLTTEGVTTTFGDVQYLKYHVTTTTTEKAFSQTATTSSWQNAVAFTWDDYGNAQPCIAYEKGNAGEHKFEVNGTIYTVDVNSQTVTMTTGTLSNENAGESDSALATVLFNGFEAEGFSATQTEYTMERFWKTMTLDVRPITNSPTATYEVDWDGSCPGTMKITCTAKSGSKTVYTFNFTNDQLLLPIASAEADKNTHGRDVNHSFDGFIDPTEKNMTWACTNLPTITYDLGEVVGVSKINVAFNSSRQRETFFDLLISKDGQTWTTLVEKGVGEKTDSNGPKSDYVTIATGVGETRYVRIYFRGCGDSTNEADWDNVNKYGSVQEISIYGIQAGEAEINGQVFDTLQEAINTAPTGATIKLREDVQAGGVMLMNDITVDLNGHTLEADYFVAFAGTDVTDSTGNGLLKCSETQLASDNTYMPVWDIDDGGYRLFTVVSRQFYYPQHEDGFTFYAKPFLGSAANNAYMTQDGDIRLEFKVCMRWTNSGNTVEQFFAYTDDQVKAAYANYDSSASNEPFFYLNVTGARPYKDNLKATCYIKSDTGVVWQVVGETFTGAQN